MFTKTLAYAVAVTLLAVVASGQEPYSVTTQMCCSGKVHDKKRGLHCCGEETYKASDNICCGNKEVVEYPNDVDEFFGCCLNDDEDTYQAFDTQTERCCDGAVVSVGRLDTGAYKVCCGTELMDYITQTCCAGVAYNKTHDLECCGDTMIEVEAGAQCCGDEVISTDSQLCCTTYEYNQATHQSSAISVVHQKTDGNDACCGTDLFNFETDVCCAKHKSGKVDFYTLQKPDDLEENEHPYCCGDDVITFKQNGKTPGRSCCYGGVENDDVSYNTTAERCCSGILKEIDEDDSAIYCCHYSGEFFDVATERCTQAGVVAKSDTLDDEPKDICTPTTVYNRGIRYY